MAKATLTINSRNYGAWSFRGWLMCRFAGIDFDEVALDTQDPDALAELLLLSPSFLVPRLSHGDVVAWGTLAIGEYLHEMRPEAGLLPSLPSERAHCRSVCGEMHSGFANLRSGLPMNIRANYRSFSIWAGAQADIDRVLAIWSDCLARGGGPYLFGEAPSMADAMFAPVCTRFRTYDVKLPAEHGAYCDTILANSHVAQWCDAARSESDHLEEFAIDLDL